MAFMTILDPFFPQIVYLSLSKVNFFLWNYSILTWLLFRVNVVEDTIIKNLWIVLQNPGLSIKNYSNQFYL